MFELNIPSYKLIFINACGFIPSLILSFFIWYNAINYSYNFQQLANGDISGLFLFNLNYDDFQLLHNAAYLLQYWIMVFLSYKIIKAKLFQILIAAILPSFIVMLLILCAREYL